MQGTEALRYADAQMILGCFEIGGRIYAIEVSQLRQVVRFQAPTPLPKAPALIEGVIDLRGALVPIVDLGRALGGNPVTAGPRARIATTEVDGLVVGFAVDAALEVLTVATSALEDPPALAIQSGYQAARAVVRRADAEPILVLSLEHLIESIYRSVLPVREEPV